MITKTELNKFPKQYGYMSSAQRAITNFENKHGIDPKIKFGVEKIDEGCFEANYSVIK